MGYRLNEFQIHSNGKANHHPVTHIRTTHRKALAGDAISQRHESCKIHHALSFSFGGTREDSSCMPVCYVTNSEHGSRNLCSQKAPAIEISGVILASASCRQLKQEQNLFALHILIPIQNISNRALTCISSRTHGARGRGEL